MPKGAAAKKIAAVPSFALGVPPIGEHELYADADSGAATVSKCFHCPVLAGNPLRNALARYFLRENCATLNRQDDPVEEK